MYKLDSAIIVSTVRIKLMYYLHRALNSVKINEKKQTIKNHWVTLGGTVESRTLPDPSEELLTREL